MTSAQMLAVANPAISLHQTLRKTRVGRVTDDCVGTAESGDFVERHQGRVKRFDRGAAIRQQIAKR